MKRACFAIAAAVIALPSITMAGPVEVRLTGVRPGGHLLVQLCSEAEGMSGCARRARLAATPGTMVVRFDDVPPGRYAASAFQDLDSNGRMGISVMGRPSEPWGYSRGARGVFGPANFSDAAVVVPAGAVVIPVALGL